MGTVQHFCREGVAVVREEVVILLLVLTFCILQTQDSKLATLP